MPVNVTESMKPKKTNRDVAKRGVVIIGIDNVKVHFYLRRHTRYSVVGRADHSAKFRTRDAFSVYYSVDLDLTWNLGTFKVVRERERESLFLNRANA